MYSSRAPFNFDSLCVFETGDSFVIIGSILCQPAYIYCRHAPPAMFVTKLGASELAASHLCPTPSIVVAPMGGELSKGFLRCCQFFG
jgi:hypothetical protein